MGQARFGLSTAHIKHSTPAEAIERCVALGLDSIEFFTAEYSVDECRDIKARCADAGIIADYHAPWGGNHELGCAPVEKAFSSLEQSVARAALMGVKHLTCHMGLYDVDASDGHDRALEQVIDITRRVIPALQDSGVVLCYEDNTMCHDVNALGTEPRDFDLLFSAVEAPCVGMTIDTGHAAITGNTRAYLELFGKRVKFFHLDDNDGFNDQHLPPASGAIDWELLFKQMAYYGAEGSFSIEFNEAYVESELPLLKDLAAEHDWRV